MTLAIIGRTVQDLENDRHERKSCLTWEIPTAVDNTKSDAAAKVEHLEVGSKVAMKITTRYESTVTDAKETSASEQATNTTLC